LGVRELELRGLKHFPAPTPSCQLPRYGMPIFPHTCALGFASVGQKALRCGGACDVETSPASSSTRKALAAAERSDQSRALVGTILQRSAAKMEGPLTARGQFVGRRIRIIAVFVSVTRHGPMLLRVEKNCAALIRDGSAIFSRRAQAPAAAHGPRPAFVPAAQARIFAAGPRMRMQRGGRCRPGKASERDRGGRWAVCVLQARHAGCRSSAARSLDQRRPGQPVVRGPAGLACW